MVAEQLAISEPLRCRKFVMQGHSYYVPFRSTSMSMTLNDPERTFSEFNAVLENEQCSFSALAELFVGTVECFQSIRGGRVV